MLFGAVKDLDGRVAIVTGATSGIGRAVAVQLQARGAAVLAVGRNGKRLAELESLGMAVVEASLTEESAWATIAAAGRRLGPVTILVNSAGRPGYLDKPIFEHDSQQWRETLRVNLDATFELSRRVAHDIRTEAWGRIIMMSSTAGDVGAPAMSAYSASKQGVIGLMRSIAQDVAPYNGTCNAILPGWVRTPMAERDAEQEASRRGISVDAVWAGRAESYPAGRVVEVEEVASVVGFLISPQASGVNGEAIRVALGGRW